MIDAGVETLILGSFPSVASLGKAQYYGHPQNQFWRLVGAAIGEPLSEMDYETRKRTLLAHRIGLWDVIASADRRGSLDAAIRDHKANALAAFAATLPRLRAVAFNGAKASAIGGKLLAGASLALITLPSSSPAYTAPFEHKAADWRRLRAFLDAA